MPVLVSGKQSDWKTQFGGLEANHSDVAIHDRAGVHMSGGGVERDFGVAAGSKFVVHEETRNGGKESQNLMLLSINLEKHKKLRENVALEMVVSKSYASRLLIIVDSPTFAYSYG